MSVLVFVDTNVIVYRFDSTEPSKQRQAEAHRIARTLHAAIARLSA